MAAVTPLEASFALRPEESALLPTERDLAFYREHGYWTTPHRVFSDAELDLAIAGQERYYRGERDRELPPGATMLNWTPGTPGLRKSDYASLQNRELATVVRKPLLSAIAAILAGADEIRLWADQLLLKPPTPPGEVTRIGWHADRNYWMTCSSEEMLTAWVPFTDVDRTMGTMMMVDGSNRWPDQPVNLFQFFETDMEGQEKTFVTGGAEIRKIPIELPRGHVSFHHFRTIHGSDSNRSTRDRRALAIHLQPGDNRFVRRTLPDGSSAYHLNDYLVGSQDGSPDYADPDICPVLYRRARTSPLT